MAPLAEAGRLATIPGRLTDLGVADVRVLADLMEPAGLSGLCSELLGERGVGFTPDELETIARVEQAVSRSATVLKRIRGNETHADDVHAVARARRAASSSTGSTTSTPPRPLPGLRSGFRRRARASGGMAGMTSIDQKERERWNTRMTAALLSAGAPVLTGVAEGDMSEIVAMAIGRARPGTVRLRLRSWEAFSRWLALNRSRTWPSGPQDLVDYIRTMVSVPAPPSFPASFSGALRWFASRTGHINTETLIENGLMRKALQWAEIELANEGASVRKAPRLPVLIMLSLELTVMDPRATKVHRVFAWARLLKVYGGLRWDDLQRLRPEDLDRRSAGLVGRLIRTKTSGVGRRIRELPLFVPREAFLVEPRWAEVGFDMWRAILPESRDFFLPRPAVGGEGFCTKVATAGDAATMAISLMSSLAVPAKVLGESFGGPWSLTTESLLPGAIAGGWTNHSERSTLVSALAAIGVGKEHRNLIGRWSPEGSDAYVRTYRAAVKELIARFIGTITSGRSYEAFDEEDAFVQVREKVVGQVGEPDAVNEAIDKLKKIAGDVSRQLGTGEELASPTEMATLPSADLPADADAEPFLAKYLVVYTHGKQCACLHFVDGCWRPKQMAFTPFELLDFDPPPRDAYNKVCRMCWPGMSAEDFEMAYGDDNLEGTDTSSGTTEDTN